MKRILIALLWISACAFAQSSGVGSNWTTVSGTLQSAAVANGNGSTLAVQGLSAVAVTVNCSVACSGGTTVTFQGSQDGTNYVSLSGTQPIGGAQASTVVNQGTTPTVWYIPVAGLQLIRAPISAYSAGTITVTATAVAVQGDDTVALANFGTGTAGTAAGGVASVQGVASMTPVEVSPTTSANGATNPFYFVPGDGAASMGTQANFGTSPGAVKALNVNASLFSGTTVLGTPNTFGTTAPTGAALGVNASLFVGTALVSGSAPVPISATTAANSATNPIYHSQTDGTNAMGTMANFGTSPGAVKALNINASLFSGTTVLGTPNTFGTTAPTGAALGVNASLFIGTTLAANSSAGVQKVGITGNAAAAFDQAPGSALAANAVQMGVSDGTDTRIPYMDPCGWSAWTYYPINISSNTQVIAGSSGKNVWVCEILFPNQAGIVNVNLVESATSGNACATSPTGMLGGATAALGANITANNGWVAQGNGLRALAKTATSGDAMCIFTSASVNGVVAYVQF